MRKISFFILITVFSFLGGCEILDTNVYTISFDTNGGTTISSFDYSSGDLFELPDTPLLDGKTFDGWFYDDAFSEEFSHSNEITRNFKLYAKWSLIDFTVTFETNGGTAVSVITTNVEETLVKPQDPTLLSNDFDAWYSDEELTILYDFTLPVNSDITLYAGWIEIEIHQLRIMFLPFRPFEEILTMTAPLSQLLIIELEAAGYYFDSITISVGDNFEEVTQALLNGDIDIAFLNAQAYATNATMITAIDVILATSRESLNKNSDVASDWNDGLPSEYSSELMVPYYRSILIVGTSPAARTLATKVNSDTPLVWEDVKDLNWCVRSTTSSSGYIYPDYWLYTNFGKRITDLTNVSESFGYGDSMFAIATGICDIGTFYTDARIYSEDDWTTDFGRTLTIWEETDVIGVSIPIMMDLIAINTDNIDSDMETALKTAFLNIISTTQGQAVFDIFSYQGFIEVSDEDYDDLRALLEFNSD